MFTDHIRKGELRSSIAPAALPSAPTAQRANMSDSAAYKATAARSSAETAKHVSSPASKRAKTVDRTISSSNVVTAKRGRSRLSPATAARTEFTYARGSRETRKSTH